MTDLIELLRKDGQIPEDLEPGPGLTFGLKSVSPNWTTYGGFEYWNREEWVSDREDYVFTPDTCRSGGLHLGNTLYALQSGGHTAQTALLVEYVEEDAGPWDSEDKRKVDQLRIVRPVNVMLAVLRRRRS
jgi:hypothetical protein